MDSKFSISSRLIPILFWISAIVNILLGFFFITRSQEFSDIIIAIFRGYVSISNGIDAILFFMLGILLIIAGVGLWKKKKGAKVLAMIITSLGILGAIVGIISPVVTDLNIFTLIYGFSYNFLTGFQINHWVYLILNGAIFGYLLFNKRN